MPSARLLLRRRRRVVAALTLVVITSAAFVGACELLVETDGLSTTNANADGSGADTTSNPTDATVGGGDDDRIDVAVFGDGGVCPEPPNTDPTLMLYLPFDEEAGSTAFDCSGRRNNALLAQLGDGGRVPGHRGGALRFDGEQTCLGIGVTNDFVFNDAFTIAAWMSVEEFQTPEPAGDSRTMLSKTTSAATRGWRFSTDDTPAAAGFKVGTADAGTFTVSGYPIPSMTWVHVAGVWKAGGDHSEIWLNGVLIKTTNPIVPVIDDPLAPVLIGCTKNGNQVLKASLDELRIYARALTKEDIAALAK